MSAPRHAIFISYRRRDSIYAVDRLDERLKHAFGADAVFRDVRSIRKGHDFPADIRNALNVARVGLVVIGPWWLKTSDDPDDSTSARRLDDPRDWVRIEIETLLGRDGVPVIPLLLGGADMPKAEDLPDTLRQLPHRHGMSLRPEPEFEDTVRRVIEEVGGLLSVPPQAPAPQAQAVLPRPPHISPTRLSVTGREFVGRAKELHLLDEAWGRSNEDKINIVSLVGQGGEGKTAIVLNWYSRRARHGWQGATRVFDWSFYSQGSSAQSAAGADEFFARAFEWFGHTGEAPKDPWTKGEKLAELIAAERTLLVLDGLEPLQQPPGDYGGELKDPAVKALLRGLAVSNPGLCILTTRTDVADLKDFEHEDGACIRHRLHALDADAARQLLRDLGVRGPAAEIDAAVREFHGHAYDLNLLGTYLGRLTDDHDIRRWREILLLKPDEHVHGKPDASGQRRGHGRRMLQAYERWLGPDSAAVAALRLLGLFDRPARSDLLDELRAAPAIPGLTDALIGLPDDEWLRALDQLQQLALITREELAASARPAGTSSQKQKPVREGRPVRYAIDAHPLLREHFAAELRSSNPDSWRAAHRRLCEYLRDTTEYRPDNLDGLQPLYQAVAHGSRAGAFQSALDEIYRKRIERDDEFFSKMSLGAFGANLAALSCFFDDQSWVKPVRRLATDSAGFVLYEAGYCLRALGRLGEAVQAIRASLELAIKHKDWGKAAFRAGELSQLYLVTGEVENALEYAQHAVAYAERTGGDKEPALRRSQLGDVLHQAGRFDDAEREFREAERLQTLWLPERPLLFRYRGFRYCELLLDQGKHHDVEERASRTLEWVKEDDRPLEIGLNHISLGKAHLLKTLREGSSDLTRAARHIETAIVALRQAGRQDHLPHGLLARAALHGAPGVVAPSECDIGNVDRARADLDEAWQIAERGSMRLFMADIHLHRARLFRDKSELAKARALIEACGYWRRKEELEDAEEAAKGWPDYAPPSHQRNQVMKKTVVELDLVKYSTICDNLEQALDVGTVAQLNQQIQAFIDAGLGVVSAPRDATVAATTGDGAILVFDSAQDAHQFAQAVHEATRVHNQSRKQPVAKRVFRIGAATGEIAMQPKPGGGFEIAGMTIARAKRLEAQALPGGLLVDEATYKSLSVDQKSLYGAMTIVPGKRDEEFEARSCQLNADGPRDTASSTEQTSKEAPLATKESDTRPEAVVLTGHVERYPVEADLLPDRMTSVSESRDVRKLVDPFFILLRVSNTLGHVRITRLRARLSYFDDQRNPYQFGTVRGVWFRQPKQDEVPQVFSEPIEIDRGDDADLVLAIKHPRQESGFALDERSPHAPGWDHAELGCGRDFHVKVELWSDSFELLRCFRLSFVHEWQGMNISEIPCADIPQSSAGS